MGLLSAQWQGYIKDYDGGTLMECLLDHRVPHVGIPQIVRAQRAALDARIRGLSQSHVVHPGLQHFDDAGRRKVIDIMTIPGARLDNMAKELPVRRCSGYRYGPDLRM